MQHAHPCATDVSYAQERILYAHAYIRTASRIDPRVGAALVSILDIVVHCHCTVSMLEVTHSLCSEPCISVNFFCITTVCCTSAHPICLCSHSCLSYSLTLSHLSLSGLPILIPTARSSSHTLHPSRTSLQSLPCNPFRRII